MLEASHGPPRNLLASRVSATNVTKDGGVSPYSRRMGLSSPLPPSIARTGQKSASHKNTTIGCHDMENK